MSSPHAKPRSRPQLPPRLRETGWTRLRAVLSLGMVAGLGAVGTMAAWSDTATATTGVFSTRDANLQIKLNQERPSYDFAALHKINLPRGGSVAGMLPVNNTGDVDFTYTVAAQTADNGTAAYGSANAGTFAQNLTVAVFAGGSASATACSGGTSITSTTLALGSKAIISTPRALAHGVTQNLCFQLTLNSAAPLAARMSALSIGFEFTATEA